MHLECYQECLSPKRRKEEKKEWTNSQTPQSLNLLLHTRVGPFSVQWLFQVWGCKEKPRVISAHREFQVTGTQPVHIPPVQDAKAIGDKRKKGEISGWVIWAGLAGKGHAPRRGCVALPTPLPLLVLGARKQHVTALIKGVLFSFVPVRCQGMCQVVWWTWKRPSFYAWRVFFSLIGKKDNAHSLHSCWLWFNKRFLSVYVMPERGLWRWVGHPPCLQQAVWPSQHVHVLGALCSCPPLLSLQTRCASLVMWVLVKVTGSSSQLLALHPLSVLKHRLLLGGIPWLSNPGVPNLQAANWYLLPDQWRH